MAEPLRTRPYRISRASLAYLAAEEYVRRFWWIVGIVPAFGVGTLLLLDHPMAKVFGMTAVLWPISIPARGVIAAIRQGKRFDHEVFLEAGPDLLRFHRADGGGWKLRTGAVRRVARFQGFLVLRLSGLGFVPVPLNAFESEADRLQFDEWLEAAR
ncbi:MAG: hypothetical protein M9921_15330 [Fimbriimonadaceae bacterium]|nr:hypothetical protein [Chthonomonadaceae bacterium]MCO5298219.1 hypothetical protein [Fimbriimonadaceae bacterium]